MRTIPLRWSRRAFTLLELLLVVVIIGILAALLLPVLSQAQARGRRAQCQSNLRQIGVAFHSFAHDHDDKFPFQVSVKAGGTMEFVPRTTEAESAYTFVHFQALSNELVTPQLLICPSDRWHTVATNFATMNNSNLSYQVAADAKPYDSDLYLAADGLGTVSGQCANRLFRHEGSANSLFADGHVETEKGGTGLKAPLANSGTTPANIPPPVSAPAVSRDVTPAGGVSSGRNVSAGGGNSAGGNRGSGNSGFAALQTFFQPEAAAQRTAPPAAPAVSDPSVVAPTPLPAVVPEPALEPIARPPERPKPVTNRIAKASVPKPAPVAASNSPSPNVEPPMTPVPLFATLERCRYCWLWIWLLGVLASVLLGIGFQRRRRRSRR